MIKFHRREQDDLACKPWLAAHWKRPGVSRRLFCVWLWGLEAGRFGISSKAIRWRSKVLRWQDAELRFWRFRIALDRRPFLWDYEPDQIDDRMPMAARITLLFIRITFLGTAWSRHGMRS